MNITRSGRIAAIIAATAVAAIALTSCAGTATTPATPTATAADYSMLTGTITAGGSSAQANAQAAWTAAFQASAKNVVVNYDKSQGSGGGVTNWTAGSYDFAGSDSPLTADQQTAATLCGPTGAINLPIYLDGVAIIFNVAGVTNLNLTADTLAKIFALKITTWNDPAIVAENPTATLPATAITTVSRSDGSGTTKTFTNYLSQVAPTVWTTAAASAWPAPLAMSSQKGTAGVVAAVTAGAGTIGYADHSGIGKLSSASIETAKGTYNAFSVDGTTAAFAAAATTATSTVAGDLAQKVDYTKVTGANMYAIPLVSYGILCTTFKTAAQATLTKAYLGYIGSDLGQQIAAKNAGSAQIPANLLAEIQTSLALVK